MSTHGPMGRFPELDGGVAVITGGAKGIGHGVARRLAAEGMRLVLADIDEASLVETAEDLGARGADVIHFVGDMGNPGDIDQLFTITLDAWEHVDVLVNNAADLRMAETLDNPDGLLERQMAVNVNGPFRCSMRAAETMHSRGRGAIINLSSVGATQAHHRGLPYDVTKGAINAMTRAMAVDLARFGIRVNAIAPGVTHTYRSDAVDPARLQAVAERIPLLRYGTVDDIAAAVAFLASDDAAYITGQILHVDGGITAQLSPRHQPL